MKNIKINIRFNNNSVPVTMINLLNVHKIPNGFAIESDDPDINTIGYAKMDESSGLYKDIQTEHFYDGYDDIIKNVIDSINDLLK